METTKEQILASIDETKEKIVGNIQLRHDLVKEHESLASKVFALQTQLVMLSVSDEDAEKAAAKLAEILDVDDPYGDSSLYVPLREWAAGQGLSWRGWATRHNCEFPGFGIELEDNASDEFISKVASAAKAVALAAVKCNFTPEVMLTIESNVGDFGYMHLSFLDGTKPEKVKYVSGSAYAQRNAKEESLVEVLKRITRK